MEGPRALLAFLTAIFGPPTPTALGKLAGEFFPFATLVVGTLPYTSSRIVFPTEVPHDDSCPVLHISTMVSHGELFDEIEDIEVIRQKIFLLQWLLNHGFGKDRVSVQESQFTVDSEPGNEMTFLEV
jgi:hypothetical protein